MGAAELVVDLRDRRIETLADFWDSIAGPLGLPDWFGRNLDALWDTIENGGISATVDDADPLIVRVSPSGLFAPGNSDGTRLIRVFQDSTRATLIS